MASGSPYASDTSVVEYLDSLIPYRTEGNIPLGQTQTPTNNFFVESV